MGRLNVDHSSGTREAADRWLSARLAPMRVELELGSSEAVKRVVAAGLGLGCLSRLAVAEAIAGGRLAAVRNSLPRASRELAIVVHRERRLGPSAEAFVEHCLAAKGAAIEGAGAAMSSQAIRNSRVEHR